MPQLTFEHPSNGYRTDIDAASILYAVLFGPLYFCALGVWEWAFVTASLASCALTLFALRFPDGAIVFGIGYVIALLSTRVALEMHYQRHGWKKVSA